MNMAAMKSVSVLAVTAVLVLGSCSDGKTASDSEAAQPKLALDCGASQPLGTDLDVPGPGRATPEEAVAPYADAMDLVAEQTGGRAVVYAVRDGEVIRQFRASERDDGWWPDGYTACTRP